MINGTEKHGVTYKLKEFFLDGLREGAEIREFYLPKDCPNFCAGCTVCFLKDEHQCKDAQYIQEIEKAMLEADLLVFVSPAYVFHASGAMKTMPDHFGYRWMQHRPAREMFGKRAVIITQCLGAGAASSAKDIKDSLSWWGVSEIRVCKFRLMSDIHREKLPEKKRAAMEQKLHRAAKKLRRTDYSKPARTGLMAKGKFMACRMIQKSVGKTKPESVDFLYWKSNGWTGRVRPWKN